MTKFSFLVADASARVAEDAPLEEPAQVSRTASQSFRCWKGWSYIPCSMWSQAKILTNTQYSHLHYDIFKLDRMSANQVRAQNLASTFNSQWSNGSTSELIATQDFFASMPRQGRLRWGLAQRSPLAKMHKSTLHWNASKTCQKKSAGASQKIEAFKKCGKCTGDCRHSALS